MFQKRSKAELSLNSSTFLAHNNLAAPRKKSKQRACSAHCLSEHLQDVVSLTESFHELLTCLGAGLSSSLSSLNLKLNIFKFLFLLGKCYFLTFQFNALAKVKATSAEKHQL